MVSLDPELIFATLSAFVAIASYNQLKSISRMANEAKRNRFHPRHELKYGLLERAFTDDELCRFFEHVDNPVDLLAWKLMAVRAFRPGEVIGKFGLRAENLDMEKGDIRIRSEKNGLLADCHLPKGLFRLLCDYRDDSRIESGPLFPWTDFNQRRKFWAVRKKARLEDSYGKAEGTGNPMYRLTQHSLRHYGITSFYGLSGKDLMATCRFARHKRPSTTARYCWIRKEEIDSVIDRMETRPLHAVEWPEVMACQNAIHQ